MMITKVTADEMRHFIEIGKSDAEAAHALADRYLVLLIRDLAADRPDADEIADILELYSQITKWYA